MVNPAWKTGPELAAAILRPPDLEDDRQFVGVAAAAKLHGRLDLKRLHARFGHNAERLVDHLEGGAKLPILHAHFDAANAPLTVGVLELCKLEDQRGIGRVQVRHIGVVGLERLHRGRFKFRRCAADHTFDRYAGGFHNQTTQAKLEAVDGGGAEGTVFAKLGAHDHFEIRVVGVVANFERNWHGRLELFGSEIKLGVDLGQFIDVAAILVKGLRANARDEMQIIGLIALDTTLGEDRHLRGTGQENASVGWIDKEAASRDFTAGGGMVKGKGAKERQTGRVVDETHRTNDEIGGASVGIGLVEVKIGGRGDIFWEHSAIEDTAAIFDFDDCRPAFGANPYIAAQAEATAIERRQSNSSN